MWGAGFMALAKQGMRQDWWTMTSCKPQGFHGHVTPVPSLTSAHVQPRATVCGAEDEGCHEGPVHAACSARREVRHVIGLPQHMRVRMCVRICVSMRTLLGYAVCVTHPW